MHRLGVSFVAALTILHGTALAQDKPTIQALSDEFAQLFNRGDAAAVAALYTEDAYLMPPGAELTKGRSAIAAFWKAAGTQIGDLHLTTVDVIPLGEVAAEEIGTFTLMTKAQTPQKIVGKYVVVWRKERDGWRLAADIWNTDR